MYTPLNNEYIEVIVFSNYYLPHAFKVQNNNKSNRRTANGIG